MEYICYATFYKYLLFLGTVCPTLKDGSAARHSFERRQLKKYPFSFTVCNKLSNIVILT